MRSHIVWCGYLATLVLLVVLLTANHEQRAYSSADKLREQIRLARYSEDQIRAVIADEELVLRELEVEDKAAALQSKLVMLELLTRESETQLEQINLREGDDLALVVMRVMWALFALACVVVAWTGPIMRWLLARRGRVMIAHLIQNRALLRAGFKVNRGRGGLSRHEIVEQLGVVRAHLAAAARILDTLFERVPTQKQSEVPMLRELLVSVDPLFEELGICLVDPNATKWSVLREAERACEQKQAEASRKLDLRHANLESEVERGVAAALEGYDLRAREAAVAAAHAERAATERRDEASRALAALAEARENVERRATAATKSEAEAERHRAAAVREHQAAEQQLQAAKQQRLEVERLLVQLEAWAEFVTDRILAELDTQPLLKPRVVEWLQLAVPHSV